MFPQLSLIYVGDSTGGKSILPRGTIGENNVLSFIIA